VSRFYRAADIFVLPSLYEGFSLVALEAAAAALPIVGTPVGIIGELVGNDEAGILIEPSARSLSEALVRLSENPSLRRRLGENAKEKAGQFSWERSTGRIVALYEQLFADKAIRNRSAHK
jgi:glycosyltransferase involved in cell wall biosynthesis